MAAGIFAATQIDFEILELPHCLPHVLLAIILQFSFKFNFHNELKNELVSDKILLANFHPRPQQP